MTWKIAFNMVLLALNLLATFHILLNKRLARAAMLWILWVWVLPWFGLFLYWYWGFNRVAYSRHPPVRPGFTRGPLDRLRTLSDSIAGTPWREGNRVQLLVDGDQAYPPMLAAIAGARRTVALQTYIFDDDAVGERFITAMEDAVARGVQVRVLVDGMGAWGMRRRLRRRLSSAGGDARYYQRVDRLFHQPLWNLRNHRKVLVVDGEIAFTGGMNISREHVSGALGRLRRLNPLRRQAPVRDLHFQIEGPLVADLQATFTRDWAKSGGPLLKGPVWACQPKRKGAGQGRLILSGPDEHLEKIYELLLAALQQARHSVDLCTPYFIPDQALLMALRGLGHAGVRVRLLVPRKTDHPIMNWASQEYFGELISAGVEVWEVQGSFVHTKVVRIDSDWCFFGSANLDPRSFRLNFELNVEMRSKALAADLDALLTSYLDHSRLVDLPVLQRRPLWIRLRGAGVNLLAPYL